jgi:hypothetical protein
VPILVRLGANLKALFTGKLCCAYFGRAHLDDARLLYTDGRTPLEVANDASDSRGVNVLKALGADINAVPEGAFIYFDP